MSTERRKILDIAMARNGGNLPNRFYYLLEARDEVGQKTYGESLHSHNGRDAWQDAIEEVADLFMYLHQMFVEDERVDDELDELYQDTLYFVESVIRNLYAIKDFGS